MNTERTFLNFLFKRKNKGEFTCTQKVNMMKWGLHVLHMSAPGSSVSAVVCCRCESVCVRRVCVLQSAPTCTDGQPPTLQSLRYK